MSIKIDKSLFTPAELAAYQALIAKAAVDTEGDEEEMEDEEGMPPKVNTPEAEPPRKRPPFLPPEEEEDEEDMEKGCRTRKSAMDPALQKALRDLEELKKSAEVREMTAVAKKYAPLGKDEAELAQTLCAMKKSSTENYEAYIGVLDESLELVNKSGLFTEIGKSSRGMSGGNAVDRIEAVAAEIQKSDPGLSRTQAIAKAWEQHPELVAEYDAEYRQ